MERRYEAVTSFLAGSSLLAEIPTGRLEMLSRECPSRAFHDGELVSRRGEVAGDALLVQYGFLKVYAHARSGTRFLVDVLGPGEWVGLGPAVLGGDRLFDHAAAGPTRVAALPAKLYRELLEQHPALHGAAHRLLAERYMRALAHLYVRSVENVEVALAHRLGDLLARLGERDARGGSALPFRLTQEEVGDLLGVSRKAAGARLRAWERAGWIELGYARVWVREPGALAALVDAGAP